MLCLKITNPPLRVVIFESDSPGNVPGSTDLMFPADAPREQFGDFTVLSMAPSLASEDMVFARTEFYRTYAVPTGFSEWVTRALDNLAVSKPIFASTLCRIFEALQDLLTSAYFCTAQNSPRFSNIWLTFLVTFFDMFTFFACCMVKFVLLRANFDEHC